MFAGNGETAGRTASDVGVGELKQRRRKKKSKRRGAKKKAQEAERTAPGGPQVAADRPPKADGAPAAEPAEPSPAVGADTVGEGSAITTGEESVPSDADAGKTQQAKGQALRGAARNERAGTSTVKGRNKRGMKAKTVAHLCQELKMEPPEVAATRLAELLRERKTDKIGTEGSSKASFAISNTNLMVPKQLLSSRF